MKCMFPYNDEENAWISGTKTKKKNFCKFS